MTSELGLNEHHQATIVNYMRFARYQRGQRIKAVDANFEDLKRSQLTDSTYTIEEVVELLDGLHGVVHGDVEDELINASHTNVLLMRQLFRQAEKWHLKLAADISELENRQLLEQIKEFEEQEFSGRRGGKFKDLSAAKLEPLNENSATSLLHMKIKELEEENEVLRDDIEKLKHQTGDLSSQRGLLEKDLASARSRQPGKGYDDEEVEGLRRQLKGMQGDMQDRMRSRDDQSGRMEADLTGTKHELLRIREMLEMTEKELEKKVSHTAPYKNLKSMLVKKNDQLKDLRRRLSRYEDVGGD